MYIYSFIEESEDSQNIFSVLSINCNVGTLSPSKVATKSQSLNFEELKFGLYDKCKIAKKLARDNNYKLTIMTGNIANPETYKWICENAVYTNNEEYFEPVIDFIRVGIGGGSGCITTSNVSIHYPQATLIDECRIIKDSYCKRYARKFPAIVADGGIRNYDHVIKALALGADYVMIGSVFAQCIESAGEKSSKNN